MHPERIGPWLIDTKIGSGGMGNVYLGHHAETGQQAAVKVLPPSMAREEGFVLRFSREIDAMRKLSNPHIVKLYDSGADGETYYYAMEYVEGETLTQRLRREKRIVWQEVVGIALQICSALKAAHDAGVIHRDLKPSNLLLANDGTVKLTDFGVAQVFAGGKLTVTGGIIGTAEYMSPEQAQGQRANKRSDLYSLGAVMYVMMTGRPPFTGNTTIEVIQKHKFGQYDRPRMYVPDIPHWLDDLICQLLEKDPDKRPPDAYVLSRRLQELLKKVELQQGRGDSPTLADEMDSDETAATRVANAEDVSGAATLMRDLVRMEVERQHQASFVGNLFNNTWFLLALLILLIVGGIAWFRSLQPSPEERFERGVALFEESGGSEWREVRDRYFLPLLEEDPDRWQEQIEPYMRQFELRELEASLGLNSKRGRKRTPQSEAERFLALARHYQEIGETARAEETLQALSRLLAADPEQEKLRQLTLKLLDGLRERQANTTERYRLLRTSLEQAAKLADEGKLDQARAIWQSIVTLYDNDPGAAEYVNDARRRLGPISQAEQQRTGRDP